ncbi:MAG: RNase J family beta-CASP ribonuclease, partial [Ruminococcus sp.]|nr:RNase J family beta-CASP ribonuclease [Ruminococcus sp.]
MNEKDKTKKSRHTSVKGSVPQKRNYRKRITVQQDYPDTPAETLHKPRSRQTKEVKRTAVRIIPLGGLNEIGKNMTVFECSNDMFILDCGLSFPDSDMPGVDIVI